MSPAAPKRGEVWMMDPEPVQGHEQGKTRPALVISDDIYNDGPAGMVIALPITSKLKYQLASHILVAPPQGGLREKSHILCDQIRTLSKGRLIRRVGAMPGAVMQQATSVIADLIGIE